VSKDCEFSSVRCFHAWPFDDESESFQNVIDDSTDTPRITVVTPSYNQGRFLEAKSLMQREGDSVRSLPVLLRQESLIIATDYNFFIERK
jgi:hypothetical protein